MLVNESVSSFLTTEIVGYFSERAKNVKPDASITKRLPTLMNFSTLTSLENQGVLVGLKLTERLLYREPLFGGMPLDIARFVGLSLWKAVFGKKVGSVKMVDKIFYLSDSNFKWLLGYSKLSEVDRIYTTAIVDSEGSNELGFSLQRGDDNMRHRCVLMYTVGLIKGCVHTLSEGAEVRVSGTYSKEGESQFVLDFK
ncbi:unnamed protein product [Phytomonas sp. EM1]|nr:unnamed protein product [Phytomonas sp. EM1]|eukprot:CCW62597.1 unnamed protein product [Phytomonas sp. isolate EM1]